jgi:hypothetical protein
MNRSRKRAVKLRQLMEKMLAQMPGEIQITDWLGETYVCGNHATHWRGEPIRVHLKTEAAGKANLNLDAMGALEYFVRGDIAIVAICI